MSVISHIGKALFRALPRRNEVLFRLSRKYVDAYRGDNNDDMRTNGELAVMRAALPNASTVFDVGANQGHWVAAALRIQDAATYHCFEPSPSTFRLLQATNLPSNVVLNNMGLGAASGSVDLFVFGDGLGANSLYERRGTDAETLRREKVTITTVDEYCYQKAIQSIDFLKLDIEGHEFAALQGARSALNDGCVRMVQFEYGGTYIDSSVLLRDVWDYLAGFPAGYRMFKITAGGLLPFPKYRQELETFQYSNWLAMTPDAARGLQPRILN